MKSTHLRNSIIIIHGRSREGAWIEIDDGLPWNTIGRVAPVRERGLKCFLCCGEYGDLSRSREGAWIEIKSFKITPPLIKVAPVRERGLKFLIDVQVSCLAAVAPVRERGLKSCVGHNNQQIARVAPVRERGLKYWLTLILLTLQKSLP